MKNQRPNILLMVADTQRVANLGCYGYDKPTSPTWDAVAAEGVVFEQNIAPGTWSLPCYASMMTGLHVHTHRADADHEYVRRCFPTLAEVLGDAGYQTCGIMTNAWGAGVVGLDRGFEVYVDRGFGEEAARVRGWDQMPTFEAAGGSELTIQQCEAWLDQRDKQRPFLLFTIFSEPHAIYQPPKHYQDQFMIEGVTEEEIESVKARQNVTLTVAEKIKFTEKEWRILFALNDAEVRRCDENFGRVINALKQRGLYDQTVIILVSDHGDVMGDRPPWWGHIGGICDSLIHVPLVIRWPEAFAPGSRVSGITQTQDIFATACEIAGTTVPEPARGQSRSLIAAADGEGLRQYALSEANKPVQLFERILRQVPDFDVRRYNRSLKAWRSTEWKYIWSSDGNDELYHIASDPAERNNLAQEKPDKVAEMRAGLEEFLLSIPRSEFGDLQSAWSGKAAWPQLAAKLQAWGLYRKVLDWPDWAPR